MDRQDGRSLATVLWQRKWIVVVAALVALGASLVVTFVRAPLYRAEVVLMRDQGSVDVTLFGSTIYQSGDVQRDLVTMAESLTSRRVAALVKEDTGTQLSPAQLLGMVTADPSTTSNTIVVRLVGQDAEEAALLVNAFAEQTILVRQQSDRAALAEARQVLETQIALMTVTDLESARGQEMLARVEQLEILEQVATGGYSIWELAEVPRSPISPRPIRDSVAGLAIGLVLGLIAAVVTDRLDRRLKGTEDFEREFQLPVLASVPQIGRRWKRSGDRSESFIGFANSHAASLETFRLLRSNLQYFEVDKGLKSIMLVSGASQEAKTVTAINLALSWALSGAKVTLVDSDLRNPWMHTYLRLDNSIGLSNVLAGTAQVNQAVKVVKSAGFLPRQDEKSRIKSGTNKKLGEDLLCLTSGPLPPNPAELLALPRMGEIVKGLCSVSDYVLIDSAPILLVADAMSLAQQVDGVIVVSRAGKATIDQAREVRSVLERVGARPVGLVISGVKGDGGRGYTQGYHQQSS
ncbi:MAG: hypothetical protein JXA57_01265 [Armatimonadetes bacterium]|nr:hypothetical protein [Armatimonadota bacterium]